MKLKNKKPLIICGCPGSGTSLFAKMLRHCGVFLGSDAGEMQNRKFHESECLRKINQFWLDQLIQFPYAPKGIHQFQKVAKLIPSRAPHLINSIDVGALMKDFFRGNEPNLVWGWKDPRNSATAAIWKQIFPEAIVLVMIRKWDESFRNHPSKSDAGVWYRRESTDEIRQQYEHPLLVPESEILRVDFDQLLANEEELNSLLLKIGLHDQTVSDFEEFQQTVGVEKSRL